MADETIDVIPQSARTQKTRWLDVNTDAGLDGQPALRADISAINNSIRNLFRCPVGERGRIRRPRYGSYLWHLLHEPRDLETAGKIRVTTIQALQKWEPRIKIDITNTIVTPSQTGFYIRIVYFYLVDNKHYVAEFMV